MEKRIFPTHRSQASLWLCLIILLASCNQPTPTVSPEATTPAPTMITPEGTTSVPTEITPESTVSNPTLTPTAVEEEYLLPEVSTETQDCVFLEGITTVPGSPGEGYLLDQVILTGVPDDIQKVLEEPDFSRQFQGGEGLTDQLPPVFVQQTGFDIRLYTVSLEDQTVLELVEAINLRAINPEDRWLVLAEPNYITRLPAGITEGSGDGGSGIVGDPGGVMSPALYGYDQFIRQWAFSGAASIRLFDDNNPHNWTPGSYTGQGVRVVVFDTTPLPQGSHDIYWAMTPFHLCVWQPGLRFTDPTPTPTDEVVRIPKGEHGLFVAGMAHGLAPESEYYLIEVLNDQARGDVYTLVRAIALYLNEPSADPSTVNTVYNLSLGLEILHEEGLASTVEPATSSLIENIKTNFSDPSSLPPSLSPGLSPSLMELVDLFPVASLKIALTAAEQMGVVVVAAAGNDGRDFQQVPADFSHVLGVAATNKLGDASCFTNPGDVAAPSGDGDRDGGCDEETPLFCPDGTENCEYAVISTVSQSPVAPSGYAYWTGTSFSAPMASGLAALIRQADGALSPEQVRNAIINCGVSPGTSGGKRGAGVINVETTILNCVFPPP